MFDLAATYAQFTVVVQLIRSQIGLNERKTDAESPLVQSRLLSIYNFSFMSRVSAAMSRSGKSAEFSGVALSFFHAFSLDRLQHEKGVEMLAPPSQTEA